MATQRKIIFANNFIYHVFNRGVDKRTIFNGFYDYQRALELLKYYIYDEIPVSYSKYLQQSLEVREQIRSELESNKKIVNVLAYCFMPNHFHFLLQQNINDGIKKFVSNFSNAYSKYFNTKNERIGHLFEGLFKAVFVESDEQLIHLSRYIHLNPIVSSLIKIEDLSSYNWSSYSEYITENKHSRYISSDLVLSIIGSKNAYNKFVMDHIDYAKKLHMIKHMVLE